MLCIIAQIEIDSSPLDLYKMPFGGTTEPFPRDTIRLLIHREANGLQNVL
jgi:hypothetical protein